MRATGALTFNEPDKARQRLTHAIYMFQNPVFYQQKWRPRLFRVDEASAGATLTAYLQRKKTDRSTLSRAQVTQEASEGRPLKLGDAVCWRARALGKRNRSLKLCDWQALPKTY